MMSISHPVTSVPRVDIVLFTLKDDALKVALFERSYGPDIGKLALPGAFVHEETDDNLLDAATRVLREKAGLEGVYMEELCSFSGKTRDPTRGWSMTIAHFAVIHYQFLEEAVIPVSSSSKTVAKLVPAEHTGPLAFDHEEIIRKALERLRIKATYSNLPLFMCGKTFTLAEVQNAYEKVTGIVFKSAENFQRKLKDMDVIEKADDVKGQSAGGRRPTLYRLKCNVPTLCNRSRGLMA